MLCLSIALEIGTFIAGLDWRARADLVALLKQLRSECSLLVISHDLRELAPVVDHAWEMLNGGTLEYRGKDVPVPDVDVHAR
jgi:energy-coupling factor transporter ATP-binding protein EcfA2